MLSQTQEVYGKFNKKGIKDVKAIAVLRVQR